MSPQSHESHDSHESHETIMGNLGKQIALPDFWEMGKGCLLCWQPFLPNIFPSPKTVSIY